MKGIFALMVASMVMASGCAPANIASVMRGSDSSNQYMETRCVATDMRDKADMDRAFAQYDGWRMVYLSEYTTGNRFGTVGAVCFERPKR
jgi:isoaspartyl peptidase/L-asparaginase-like protein (Ntn-hydrolase superfamily)